MTIASQSIQYNGALFAALYRTQVTARPIQDEARRTTVYVEHTLEVDGYVVAQTTDQTLTDLRKKLTQPAGSLTYNLKGYGDFRINSPGGVLLDACWGPIPELMQFIPLGGDCNAARVTWRVTVRIPECDFAKYRFAMLALNWSVDHDLDESGYTVQRIKGYLEIPITRNSVLDRTVPDSVDRYREQIESDEIPLGFQRSAQSFRVSADRRRLDFGWTDTELPAALPRLVTVADANHTVRTGLGQERGLTKWSISFDARLVLARGAPKDLALVTFLAIVASRTRGLTQPLREIAIPRDFEIRDSIFGRDSSLRLTFDYFHNGPVSSFMAASGLWQPIAGTDYNGWQASLTALRTSSVRGWAGLQVLPSDDLIVDLCANGGNPSTTLGANPPGPGGAPNGNLFEAVLKTILRPLDPENSWLEYRIRIIQEDESGVVRHKPSPTPDRGLSTGDPFGNPSKGPNPLPGGVLGSTPIGQKQSAADDAVGAMGSPSKDGSNPPDYYQRAVMPTRRLGLEGFAVRVGYRVPVPQAVSIGGIAAVEQYRWAAEEVVGSIGDIPIWRTDWQLWYMLADAPAGPWPWPANPVLGTDGGLTGNQGDLRPF